METIETVFGSIGKHAENFPDKVALIAGKESVTYAQLASRVNSVALSLDALAVTKGARVGVDTTDVVDHLVGTIGVMAFGAIPVALPSVDQASYRAIVEDAVPTVLIHEGGVVELLEGEGQTGGAFSFDELKEKRVGESINFLERNAEPEEIAMFYYTSGTSSGIRKGVMQSYRMLHNTAEYIVNITQQDSGVREFVASSVDNAFWFGRCRCVLKVGGTILLHEGTLNPLAIIDSIKRNNGNAISGDTPVYLLLMNYMEKNFMQIAPAIRWAKIASQPMPVKEKQRLINLLPNARIVMGYGLTEAMRTSLLPFNECGDKLASDGLPCPGVSIAILNSQGEIGRTPRELGEVLISGGNLASGYWHKEQMWKDKLVEGWYKTGDLGYLDEDGYLFLQGRKDHAINSGGKTIALSEVEARLRPHFVATTFVACGMNDPRGVLGEVVILCVEGEWKEKKSWKDLRVHLFECMEPAFVPKEAFCIPQFPRTANGKIQLSILREKVEQGQFPKC